MHAGLISLAISQAYALLAVTNLLTTFTGMATELKVPTAHMPLAFALVLTIPDVVLVAVEEGFVTGFKFLTGKIVTLGPFYYIFLAQTRAYHMTNTLRWGKASGVSEARSMVSTSRPRVAQRPAGARLLA